MQKRNITDTNLLDVVLSFGQNQSFQELIENSLTIFLEQLYCNTACYYRYNKESGSYSLAHSNTSNGKAYLKAVSPYFSDMVSKLNTLTLFEEQFMENSWYGYRLQTKDWLVLGTNHPFDTATLKKLESIFPFFNTKLIEHATKDKKRNNQGALHQFDSDMFEHIVRDSHNSLLISDEGGTLCYANNTAKEWLGIDTYIGENIKVYDYEKFFEGDKKANWQKHLKELKSLPEIRAIGNLVNFKNGATISTDVVVKHTYINGKGFVLANSKDVTESMNIKKSMIRERKLQDLLLRMASTYININLSDVDNIINASLGEIGDFVSADRAYIFEYDFINQTTSNIYEWCSANIAPEIENLQEIPISAIPDWINAHRAKKSFIVQDTSKLKDTGPQGLKAILEPQGIKSLIALPMLNADKLIGFVGFDSVKNLKTYSSTEETLLFVYSEILVNIELRQKYEFELVSQKERFRRIISSINLGLIEVNHDYRILFANNSFLEYYDYKWASLVGQHIFEALLNKKDIKRISKLLTNLEDGEVIAEEITTFDRHANKKVVFISIVKQNDTNGSYKYLVAIVDLTAQKRLEKELRDSLLKTEEASRSKELFFASISHELRTPLNIINGVITEIVRENLSKDTLFLLNQANAASTHMLNLVNNILDFAKINVNELKLEQKDFKLTLTIKETFDIFRLMADEKNISFELDFSEGIYEFVKGDFIKLRQILINIIGNAIKFTAQGYVKLKVNLVRDYPKRQSIEFIITDTGQGMDNDFIEKGFDNFQQDITADSLQIGTGLGMPISKKLLNIMGGDLLVESKKKKGTKVRFCLNFEKRNPPMFEDKVLEQTDILKGKYILVAEDNYMNSLILDRKLSKLGATVLKVENGKLALEMLNKQKIDLILMDIQMPVMNGIQATMAIRKTFGQDIPIIAITANVFKENIDQYMGAGMNDVIIKPFDDKSLYTKVVDILEIKVAYALGPSTSKKTNKIQPTLFSVNHLRDISNGDDVFFDQMIVIFLKMASDSVHDLAYAIKIEDLTAIKQIAHKLRVSLADLNAVECLEIAAYLDVNDLENLELKTVLDKTSELIRLLKDITASIEQEFM